MCPCLPDLLLLSSFGSSQTGNSSINMIIISQFIIARQANWSSRFLMLTPYRTRLTYKYHGDRPSRPQAQNDQVYHDSVTFQVGSLPTSTHPTDLNRTSFPDLRPQAPLLASSSSSASTIASNTFPHGLGATQWRGYSSSFTSSPGHIQTATQIDFEGAIDEADQDVMDLPDLDPNFSETPFDWRF